MPKSMALPPQADTTSLTPAEEMAFRQWVSENGITDVDHPDSRYDYRGYWKAIASRGQDVRQVNSLDHLLHYPDTFKQHGHPTFSAESQYSRGPQDGGQWIGETLVAPPMPSHDMMIRLADLLRVTRRAR